ncbi:MAG: winged helix-turn-helix domain-containing protein [Thermoanaerobaculales bacterium]
MTRVEPSSGVILRFGEFELGVSNAELRRDGKSVRLPPQPFAVLVLLASNPGQLLTRQKIREYLWGEKTFVDFELGINYCLNQIRKALGDDVQTPRYVETVPRRGYRFIAPVEAEHPLPGRTSADTPSVAVLPFANLSANRHDRYFGDGLADGIITALTRVEGLRVTARTSSFAFRDAREDVREIGARLGVGTLLEGSVQRSHSRVRVSAQLVDVSDGFHLWSESYDRDLIDVFAIEDEISRAIAHALEVRLAPLHAGWESANLDAYKAWLKARHYQRYESLEALPKARTCLDQAIALDSLFPQPYLGLADLLLASATFGLLRPNEAATEGRAAIGKALEMDESMGEAHALSGAFRALMDFDWEGAAADFDRALALAPASELAHRLRATYYLVPTCRLKEAEQEMERALELDLLSPMAHVELVKVLLWARRFDRAQVKVEAALELWPQSAIVRWFFGATRYFQGHIEEAITLWQEITRKGTPSPSAIAPIGMALGRAGRKAEARALLANLKSVARDGYVPALDRAKIYAGLGETDTSLQWVSRAIEQHEPEILELPSKAIWDGLRDDPRFTELLRKMHLA